MSDIKSVDNSNFKNEVLDSDVPVLVDFSATWCAPCQRMLPTLEKFSNENSGKVKVVKVDVDDSPDLASSYGIKSVPAFHLFKNGKPVESKVGMMSITELTNMLNTTK